MRTSLVTTLALSVSLLLAACGKSGGTTGSAGSGASTGGSSGKTTSTSSTGHGGATGSASSAATTGSASSTAAAGSGGATTATTGSGGAGMACGAFAGDAHFNCGADGNGRGKCVNGALVYETCDRGCLRQPAGQDDLCLGTTNTWSCGGSYGKVPVEDGDYYITEFGCWQDASGIHTDPSDNCIPSCLSQAQSSGLCAGMSGPACEETVNWYAADGARFGCLARLRVTNPANGKAVVVVALDFGPACSVENSVQHAVLDMSAPANNHLFGSAQGASDKSLVHVIQVDAATPLGIVN